MFIEHFLVFSGHHLTFFYHKPMEQSSIIFTFFGICENFTDRVLEENILSKIFKTKPKLKP